MKRRAVIEDNGFNLYIIAELQPDELYIEQSRFGQRHNGKLNHCPRNWCIAAEYTEDTP